MWQWRDAEHRPDADDVGDADDGNTDDEDDDSLLGHGGSSRDRDDDGADERGEDRSNTDELDEREEQALIEWK